MRVSIEMPGQCTGCRLNCRCRNSSNFRERKHHLFVQTIGRHLAATSCVPIYLSGNGRFPG